MRAGALIRAVVAVAAGCLLCVAPAQAAFPGDNGRLVVADSAYSNQANYQRLWTMAYDGSSALVVTPDSVNSRDPAWSADGEKIAFSRYGGPDSREDIWTIDADGGNPQKLTSIFGQDRQPTWSPDGSRIAFQTNWDGNLEIYVVNADGSGLHNITNDIDREDFSPVWSPDGTRISFVSTTRNNSPNVTRAFLMDPDGGNRVQLPQTSVGRMDWSPDGAKLAYSESHDCGGGQFCVQIHVMNADGTNDQVVATGERHSPHWSPDGTQFVYRVAFTIGTMNVDGTNAYDHPYPGAGQKSWADWQPLTPAAINRGHPRPKGATPVRVPLVPGFKACSVGPNPPANFNRNHGPPLEYLSCNPPRLQSSTLTVGTPDANGNPAESEGSVTLATVVGNPATPADEADVNVDVSITDVRCSGYSFDCRGPGLDYEGSMLLDVGLRITDKLNGPAQNLSATVQDTVLRAPFTCVATASSSGSTCSLHTSADAVIPGMVPEGKRSVWGLGQVTILDSGLNGTGYANCPPTCGDGDETTFLRQGLFVP